MDLKQRIKCYKAIEGRRKRPLIVYATSTRPGVPAMLSADATREFVDQIDAVPLGRKDVDVLIHSTGGDGLTAWKIMSLLRGRFSRVGVLVPYCAFSAATLFALGADEIVMHPHASLGPIDPQIQANLGDGKQILFAYEDVGAFLRFVAEDVRLTEQAYVSAILEKLFATVNPLQVGGAKRASDLSSDVGERLLAMHMKGPEERRKAREIAESLNKSFFSHSDAISRERARELKLRIAGDDPRLERLLWDAYLALESFMEFRKPFHPLAHFLADPQAAASVVPLGPVSLPVNTPPQLIQQIWTTIANKAIAESHAAAVEVLFSHVGIVVESPRCASELRSEGAITGARVGHDIEVSITARSVGWRKIPVRRPRTPGSAQPAAVADRENRG